MLDYLRTSAALISCLELCWRIYNLQVVKQKISGHAGCKIENTILGTFVRNIERDYRMKATESFRLIQSSNSVDPTWTSLNRARMTLHDVLVKQESNRFVRMVFVHDFLHDPYSVHE